jgi:hypothetical protein
MTPKWQAFWFGTSIKDRHAIASLDARLKALEESQKLLQQSVNEIKALVSDIRADKTSPTEDDDLVT